MPSRWLCYPHQHTAKEILDELLKVYGVDPKYPNDSRSQALKELEAILQQEIAKAKEQERNNIIEYVQVNQKGQFEEDSTGSVCWYLDDLVEALKEHKEVK